MAMLSRYFGLSRHIFKAPLRSTSFLSQRNCCDFILSDPSKDIGIVGRTMEFGADVAPEIIVQQKGLLMDYGGLQTPDSGTRFGYLKTNGAVRLSETYAITAACDGFNDQGLTCDLLYFPKSCRWPAYDISAADRSIKCTNLLEYILGNCGTVEEVSALINHSDINIWGDDDDNMYYTCHFQVFDTSGKGLVIEFINGVNCSQDSIGVMTNEPEYSWHEWNLKQYGNLTNTVSEEADSDQIGQGTGLVGLPGDPTPPSRFIRCYLTKKFIQEARKPETVCDAIVAVHHIINSVDICRGMVKNSEGMDYTQWSCMKDMFNLQMYFRPYDSLNWQLYDMGKTLSNLDLGKSETLKKMDVGSQRLNFKAY